MYSWVNVTLNVHYYKLNLFLDSPAATFFNNSYQLKSKENLIYYEIVKSRDLYSWVLKLDGSITF